MTDPAVILGILTLISTIAGFVYTWFKDARDRKWRLEDAANKSQHLNNQDDALQANNVAIEDGKQHALKAYTEANATNEKIAALQQELKALAKPPAKTD